jgi:hypothetical protein
LLRKLLGGCHVATVFRPFIDCAGVYAILAANAGAEWGVPRLILVPGDAVERLLKLAGASEQIWTFDVESPDQLPEPALAPELGA